MLDEIALANGQLWERLVKEGCGFTIPWLGLDREQVRRYAADPVGPVPDALSNMYPPEVLAHAEGKRVLCLASGGGQQSAVFGLLGAHVTVVDLSQGQLDGDRQAAQHFGHAATTIQGDMRDLSGLPVASFDLVYQGPSMCFVPDVRRVYAEVARVLKIGGVYRVELGQPAIFSVEWKDTAYCITQPYTEQVHRRTDGGIEFRHYLGDIFGGLLQAGFAIEQVCEEPCAFRPDAQMRPGSWAHQQSYVSGGFAIVARKGGRLESS